MNPTNSTPVVLSTIDPLAAIAAAVATATQQLATCATMAEVEDWRQRYLGYHGTIRPLINLGQKYPDKRDTIIAAVHVARFDLVKVYEARKLALQPPKSAPLSPAPAMSPATTPVPTMAAAAAVTAPGDTAAGSSQSK